MYVVVVVADGESTLMPRCMDVAITVIIMTIVRLPLFDSIVVRPRRLRTCVCVAYSRRCVAFITCAGLLDSSAIFTPFFYVSYDFVRFAFAFNAIIVLAINATDKQWEILAF